MDLERRIMDLHRRSTHRVADEEAGLRDEAQDPELPNDPVWLTFSRTPAAGRFFDPLRSGSETFGSFIVEGIPPDADAPTEEPRQGTQETRRAGGCSIPRLSGLAGLFGRRIARGVTGP